MIKSIFINDQKHFLATFQLKNNFFVFVFIHNNTGHVRTKEFDGSVLAAQTDSIVAMMNYRVGVFGFLNLNHPEVDGNQGMYDQVTEYF